MKLWNTLSGEKEIFTPINDNRVTMYCCGVTPYSHTHIGHSRTFFSYDLLYRTLVDQGYAVSWARNITDVDDKIIQKAQAEETTCEHIVDRYVAEQDRMLETFSLLRPDYEPRVTAHMGPIVELIQRLIEKDFAYQTTSGVYFRVRQFPRYGRLSRNKINDLKAGVRIEVDEKKEDPLDFALWKYAKPGEIFWDSPWGPGRPGWHIECSAMIHTLFGDSIDIHMGGRDLIFPHHEAEIAQSEACTDHPLARVWLHAGMVTLYKQKMSKSTNHFVSIQDFLDKYPPEVLRLLFLSCSYGQMLDFTWELAEENLKKLCRLYRFMALVDGYCSRLSSGQDGRAPAPTPVFAEFQDLTKTMQGHLADDLNSSAALASLFYAIKQVNSKLVVLEKHSQKFSAADHVTLSTQWPAWKAWMQKSLGLLSQTPKDFFEGLARYGTQTELSPVAIAKKIEARDEARKDRDWSTSDSLREELEANGVLIQDTPSGTTWTVKIYGE